MSTTTTTTTETNPQGKTFRRLPEIANLPVKVLCSPRHERDLLVRLEMQPPPTGALKVAVVYAESGTRIPSSGAASVSAGRSGAKAAPPPGSREVPVPG